MSDYILPQTLMIEILENSCSNPHYPEGFDYLKAEKKMHEWNRNRPADVPNKSYPAPPGGWHRYEIELHCAVFTVIARKKRNTRTKKYSWQIKSVDIQR